MSDELNEARARVGKGEVTQYHDAVAYMKEHGTPMGQAKPVEVGVHDLRELVYDEAYAGGTPYDVSLRIAQAILERFNVTVKE